MSCEKETTVKDAESLKDEPPVKDAAEGALPERSYSGKKRGRKVGDGKKLEITVAEWWDVCDGYRKSKVKMNKTAWLKSTNTSDKFTGTKSQQQSFGRYLEKYDSDPAWRPVKKFKTHKRLFEPLEDKLIKYLEARGQKFKRDKLGVSWNWLKLKCNEWAEQMNLKGWDKCSDGWLYGTLKRHGFEHTKLHGEAEDMSKEDDLVMEAVVEEELEAIEKDISEVEDLAEEEIVVKKLDERKPPTRVEITEAIDTLRLALGSTESSLELSHKLDTIQRYLQKQQ